MTIKRILAFTLAAGALALGASAVAVPQTASAHTPEASATCSTLTVALSNYTVGANGAMINSMSVEIDSAVIDETDFGSSLHESYSLGDTAVAHDYVVEIDASGTQYDRDFSGTSVPCKRAVTADADAALTVTPATCDTNGALVLGESENSTWGTPTAVAGPAAYSAIATADAGHAFADGSTTKSFAGTLEGMADADQTACAAVVIVPDRPAPIRDVTDQTDLDCDSATRTTTTTTTTTDWALEPSTNAWVTMPAVVTTTTATVAAPAGECPSIVIQTPPAPADPPSSAVTVTPLTPAVITPLAVPSTPADPSEPAVPVEVLASTGSNAGTVAPIAAGILLAGVALVLARRLGARRTTTRG